MFRRHGETALEHEGIVRAWETLNLPSQQVQRVLLQLHATLKPRGEPWLASVWRKPA